MLKEKALKGVLQRVKGRRATRMQALVAAVGAGVVVYKLLRSGKDDDGGQERDAEDEAEDDEE